MEKKNIVKIKLSKDKLQKLNLSINKLIKPKEKFNCFQIYIIKLQDIHPNILITICDLHHTLNKIADFESTYGIEKNSILKNEKSGVVIDNDISSPYVLCEIYQSIKDEKSCHVKFSA